MPWAQTDATHAQLGLPEEGCAIEGFVVYNNRAIRPAKHISIPLNIAYVHKYIGLIIYRLIASPLD